MADERDIEVVLQRCEPEVRTPAESLRELLRTAAPEATERGYTGWGNIVYDHNGMFCYIAPLKGSVNLGFHGGPGWPTRRDCCEARARGCGTLR